MRPVPGLDFSNSRAEGTKAAAGRCGEASGEKQRAAVSADMGD